MSDNIVIDSLCIICRTKAAVSEAHRVYIDLQRISKFIEMEINETNKILKSIKYCLPHRTKDVGHFLSKGQIYLNMRNNLYERNQKISAVFTIIFRTMDIYSKLNEIFEAITNDEDDSNVSDNENEHREDSNIIPIDIDVDLDESNESDISESDIQMWLDWISRLKFMLANIESLIIRIKSLCVAFTKSNSALYIILCFTLRLYCERVELFLHNTRIMELRQERSLQDMNKYDLLEQLLARINKEQEYVEKYVDLKFKKESGN